MLKESAVSSRSLKKIELSAELAVIGGGAAGCCCAITAARAGLKVVLVQDRPVLGGNASSEVRLWLLGATCHMMSNNRWAREGGVVNELMMENLWRNPEGNPLIFDSVLLESVVSEPNITLLLNTSCFEVEKLANNPDRISSVSAYCSQNETLYRISAPYFCDSSGDGVVGFLSGAAFRMGAESKKEFGEEFAPTGEFGHLLGHSIYFYTKDIGKPVKFVAPSFALEEIEDKIPRYKQFSTKTQGCMLWWIEWGGRLDTVHETEKIKWELWKVVYGVWNYIKNSGKFPDAANLTLEWVGHIPGKRESRRFEGDYMLQQGDVVERRLHDDAVAFGGWSIDLHPADGVFAEIAGSHHLHSKGIYQIPYRCYYSRNVENLFLAGRIISATHVAFGSTRVMCTCALGGQAIAEAAKLCVENNELPRDIGRPERMRSLQQRLAKSGHFIPGVVADDPADLARIALASADSTLKLAELPKGGPDLELQKKRANEGAAIVQMIPLPAGQVPSVAFWATTKEAVNLQIELRTTSDPRHHTPDVLIEQQTVRIPAGVEQEIELTFSSRLDRPGYGFLCFAQHPDVSLRTSELRVTGLLRLANHGAERSAKVGGEDFEVYTPERRPGGHNIAMRFTPAIELFQPANVLNGWQRPTSSANAWVAEPGAISPTLTLEWGAPQAISEVVLFFDGDFDHAMESVLWGHPEQAVPFCVKRYEILDDAGNILATADDNHQSRVSHRFNEKVTVSKISVKVLETWGAPAAIFEVRCY